MPSPKGYTTKAAVESFLGITISGSIDSYILAAEEVIDGQTGRNFKADSTAAARLYDGDDSNILLIDDCVEITKVEIGQDQVGESFREIDDEGSNKYFARPNNHAALGVPISEIVLSAACFVEGMQNQKITAKWGYSATPPSDIQQVATILAAGMYNAKNGSLKSEAIGNYSVSYDNINGAQKWNDLETAMDVLKRYVKIYI